MYADAGLDRAGIVATALQALGGSSELLQTTVLRDKV
jgi:hypothetical protein